MTLKSIEQIVLNLIGMRYDDLSISTDSKEILDFAMLHTCINLAREEIKLNADIPALVTIGAAIPSVAAQSAYSLPIDFDIPIKIFYQSASGGVGELAQIYVDSIADRIDVTNTGTPSSYIIGGTVANLIQIYLLPIPNITGESLLPVYKSILTELSLATAEDVVMRKYPKAVIDFATAFAWQLLKKDQTQYDKYYAYGMNDCMKIDFREVKADSNFKELPPLSIRNARASRLSQ